MLEASIPPSLPAPARADQGVDLVQEMISSSGGCDILDHLLQQIPRSRPWYGCGDQAGQVELDDPLVGWVCGDAPSQSARPASSTLAVLPTPRPPRGATGLFLVRGVRISTACSISSDRPITGSHLVVAGQSVRSGPYWRGWGCTRSGPRPSGRPPLGGWGRLQRSVVGSAADCIPPRPAHSGVERQRHQECSGADRSSPTIDPGELGGVELVTASPPGERQVRRHSPRGGPVALAPPSALNQRVRVGPGGTAQVAQGLALLTPPREVVGVPGLLLCRVGGRRAASASISGRRRSSAGCCRPGVVVARSASDPHPERK